MEAFKKRFPITSETIFAYGTTIYTDHQLPKHLEIHERVHLKQQARTGKDIWIEKYLTDTSFRLKQEIEAYTVQVNSIKDREARNRLRIECAKHLSSSLYGNLLSLREAISSLK